MRAGLAPFELAAVGPPEFLGFGFFGGELGVDEGFAVGDVAAVDDAEPVAAGHLFGGEVSPAAEDVAFVLDLVVDDGFLPGGEPARVRRRSRRSGCWRG